MISPGTKACCRRAFLVLAKVAFSGAWTLAPERVGKVAMPNTISRQVRERRMAVRKVNMSELLLNSCEPATTNPVGAAYRSKMRIRPMDQSGDDIRRSL